MGGGSVVPQLRAAVLGREPGSGRGPLHHEDVGAIGFRVRLAPVGGEADSAVEVDVAAEEGPQGRLRSERRNTT